jgi:hypothetical protein
MEKESGIHSHKRPESSRDFSSILPNNFQVSLMKPESQINSSYVQPNAPLADKAQ